MQPLERPKYVPKNVSFKASRNSNFLWHSLSRTSVQSQVKPAYKGVHCLFKCFSFALFRFYFSLFWKQPWPWNKEMWTWQHKKSRALIFSKFYFSGDLRQINFLYARWSKIRIFLLRSTCGKKEVLKNFSKNSSTQSYSRS